MRDADEWREQQIIDFISCHAEIYYLSALIWNFSDENLI